MINEKYLKGTIGKSKNYTVINNGNATSTVTNLYQPKRQKKCDACYADTAEWYAIPYNYHNEVNEYDSNLILCKVCFEHLLDAVRERRQDETD